MIELTTSPQVTQRRDRWKWFLALGVLLLVLGIAGVGIATVLELTSLLVFGPMLLVSSLLQFLTSFLTEKGRESAFHFAAAGLEAILGFVVMAYPPQTMVGLMGLVAVFLILAALVRLARARAAPSRSRAVVVLTGVLTLVLGISLWIGWPVARLWFVGVCLAVDFIFHGVSWSALAWAERQPGQARVP